LTCIRSLHVARYSKEIMLMSNVLGTIPVYFALLGLIISVAVPTVGEIRDTISGQYMAVAYGIVGREPPSTHTSIGYDKVEIALSEILIMQNHPIQEYGDTISEGEANELRKVDHHFNKMQGLGRYIVNSLSGNR